MTQQEIKIRIGKIQYRIVLDQYKRVYTYSIYANKKAIVHGTFPLKDRMNIKMILSQKIIQHAFFEVNYEIEKLKI